VAEYQRWLEQAGFAVLTAEDRTLHFIRILEQEAARLPTDQFDPQTLRELRQSWQAKIARAQRGEQRWGLFVAQKLVR
jgi:hypothetical protein